MIKSFLPLLLLVCIFFLHDSHAGVTSHQYSLTLAGARQVVTLWLEENGYTYQVIPQPGGFVRIQSSNKNKKWLIDLKPRSALATWVGVQVDDIEQKEERIAELFLHLEAKSSRETGPTDQQPEIPGNILEKISSVACIHAQNQGQKAQFSGVFIDKQGLILSTAHDLKEHEEVSITSAIGTLYKGDIIKIDFKRDLALIQVVVDQQQAVSLEDGRNLLSMGDKVFSVGCPNNLPGTVSSGFINGPPRLVDNIPLWQASLETQPGSSGSPVFDGTGVFVGLIKGRHRDSPGIGFLIPLEVIIDFLSDQGEQ